MEQPTIPVMPTGQTTDTAVLQLPPAPPAGAAPQRRRTARTLAAVAVSAALVVGGIAIGAQWGGGEPVALTAEQAAARAGSVDEAVGILGVDESLSSVTDGTTAPDGIAGILDEVITRLEAAAAAGPDNEVTQGLRDVASALRAAQRGLEGVESEDLTSVGAYLPLLLGLLQQILGDAV